MTNVDSLQKFPDGSVSVRFTKKTLEGTPQYHRAVFIPDVQTDFHLSEINKHLVRLGESEIDPAQIPALKTLIDSARTPQTMAIWQQQKDKAAAELEAMKPANVDDANSTVVS